MFFEYNELCKNSKDLRIIRKKLVDDAARLGVKKAARKWKTTPKTVRKWRRRFANDGIDGLSDRSRRPKNSPRRMGARWRFCIQDAVEKGIRDNKRINAATVKSEKNIPFSPKTVRKEMKRHGYETRHRNKARRKNDLRLEKAKMRAFEKIQIDIKYLDDIPEFYRDWRRFDLPKYQITARDVKTGALFFAYAREKTSTNTTLFLLMLGEHLRKNGVDISRVVVQTDNGTEFASAWNSLKDSAFTKAVKTIWRSEHRRVPPKACTWQSDVETSHNLIENEFYAIKYFESRTDFFEKAAEWQRFFNMERINKSKRGSPLQLLDGVFPKEVLAFKPVVVDYFWNLHKNDFAIISSA